MKTSTIECNGSLVDCGLCSMDCMQPHCQILIFNLFSRDIVINCSAGLQCTLHLPRTEQAPPLKSHQQLLTRVSNKLVPQEGRETQPIVKSVERTTHYAHHLKENLHNNFCSLNTIDCTSRHPPHHPTLCQPLCSSPLQSIVPTIPLGQKSAGRVGSLQSSWWPHDPQLRRRPPAPHTHSPLQTLSRRQPLVVPPRHCAPGLQETPTSHQNEPASVKQQSETSSLSPFSLPPPPSTLIWQG